MNFDLRALLHSYSPSHVVPQMEGVGQLGGVGRAL
jgi:hypothetical protein